MTEQFGAPDPQTRAEYKASMGEQVDQMLYVIYGLLGIAVLIAVMGIGNTLALSIHERTRELGLLRAVGQSRAQLRSSLRWESVIVAVFGTVGGLGLGTFLGWGLMRALQRPGGVRRVRPARRAAGRDPRAGRRWPVSSPPCVRPGGPPAWTSSPRSHELADDGDGGYLTWTARCSTPSGRGATRSACCGRSGSS